MRRKAYPEMISVLLDEGLNNEEIAARIGWTIGTLRVRCSQLKISLRRSFRNLVVPKSPFDQLHHYATLMGFSQSELAADLLKTIIQDDLYNAVLDRDVAKVTPW